MSLKHFHVQLKDFITGRSIISSGGVAQVCQAGLPDKEPIYDIDGGALTNPVALVRGSFDFWVDVDTLTVDVYGIAPGGQAFEVKEIGPSGPNEIGIDTSRKQQCMVVPFAIADCTTDVEKATGFNIPATAMVLPTPFIRMTTEQSGDTIDVGTLASASGDADGFIDGASVGSAGLVKATLLASGDTMGAYLSVLDSANAGDDAPEGAVAVAGKQISYTLIGTVTLAAGFINLPYVLSA